MAEDASKLREQIAFLSSLINTHKQKPIKSTEPSNSSLKQEATNSSTTWKSTFHKSQNSLQVHGALSGLRQTSHARKSAYSLDRRKINSKTPGIIPLNPNRQRSGESGTPSLSSLKWAKQSVPMTPKVSSNSEQQRPHFTQAKPKTADQQKGLTSTHLKTNSNPYVLNKKNINQVTTSTESVPNRTALHWRKPGVPVASSSVENPKSHSDSELYTYRTREDKSAKVAEIPLQGKVSQQVQASAVHAAPYKWEKSRLTNSRASNLQRRTKPLKGSGSSVSRLKWTAASSTYTVKNPYVLRKETSNTHSKGVVHRRRTSKSSPRSLPCKNRLVWRSKSLLKLDRRKCVPSGSLSVEQRKSLDSFMQRRKKVVLQETLSVKPLVSRFSVISSKQSAPIKAEKSSKVVFIGGVAYKSSANKLAKAVDRKSSVARKSSLKAPAGRSSLMVHINGEKFVMDGTGKTLKRVTKVQPVREAAATPMLSEGPSQRTERRRSFNKVVIGGVTFLQTAPGTLVRAKPLTTQALASRVLRQSVKTARVLKRKEKQKYCMFYNRFGKCNKGDKCPFIHDASKVAVCTKFLRGTCKNTDGSCPFSHKIDPDKMPVCQFFLRGTCTNDNCPYSHVNVSKTAQVCEDFVAGFCPRGQKCKKKHMLECEEFKVTGTCSKGSGCRLVHRKRKERKAKRRKSSAASEHEEKRVKLEMSEHEGFLPLSCTEVNEDNNEGLSTNSQGQTTGNIVEPLTIRPRFLKLKDDA